LTQLNVVGLAAQPDNSGNHPLMKCGPVLRGTETFVVQPIDLGIL
jgi:hypothetical protein